VPEIDVRRRFKRSINNFFEFYKPLLFSWMIFDNSGQKPELIAREKQGILMILNEKLFETIRSGGN
jgi:predicted ABC-type ATPase